MPPPPPPAPGDFVVVVTDKAALAAVEKAGGRFADLVSPAAYRGLVATVSADVAAAGAGDPEAGVGLLGHAHRLFDVAWLAAGRFELVGVVNRMDFARVTPGACGDVRLVYRLTYESEQEGARVASRLPMTALIVLRGRATDDGGGCRTAAMRWRMPAGAALGDWLVAPGGPLGDGALAAAQVDRVLTDLQVVRWPSTVHGQLGGHAQYALREHVVDPASGALVPSPLLAVPDVARIAASRRLRAQLLAWLRDRATLDAIDRGEVRLPVALRATSSHAYTPRGLSRRANRPYRSLLAPRQLARLPLAGRRWASTREALLLRLDEQTCAGCHQARTIAGFHLLGDDGAEVAPGNAIAVPMSPHLVADLPRRRRIVEAFDAGEKPDLAPSFSSRAPSDRGGSGSRCGLGDAAFAAWTCADGLACSDYDSPADDRVLGVCAGRDAAAVGEACQIGPVLPGRIASDDRVPERSKRPCAAGSDCKKNRRGFPGGMCGADDCAALPPGATCALIAGPGFDECLIAERPFTRCVADNVMQMALRACSREAPCRDDYVCARTRDGGGACVPPYFLFQLRVDGHPPAAAPR